MLGRRTAVVALAVLAALSPVGRRGPTTPRRTRSPR
jgi:hypothetical protein